jgi:predicted Fe-Mo cluster-binding NifX family protein
MKDPERSKRRCRMAVTSRGRGLDSRVGSLARSPYILVFEGSPDKYSVIEERSQDARDEPGVRAAEALVGKKIAIVITGTIGKSAHEVLKKAGMSVKGGCKGTIADAVKKCAEGRLAECMGATYAGNVDL